MVSREFIAAFIRRHPVRIMLIPVMLVAAGAGVWLWGPARPGEAPGARRGGGAVVLSGPATPLATAPGETGADELAMLALVDEPWTGDLDGMIERGFIRVLTVHNPMFFALDGVEERGLDVEMGRLLEAWLRARQAGKAASRLKVVVIPTPRDQLFPRLLAGRGDIVMANLTITPERARLVDFSIPTYENVSELLVTGPRAPNIATIDDVPRVQILARRSSSYFEHIEELNETRWADGKRPLRVRAADERLEDYDLLQMVDAGMIRAVVVDSHKAAAWAAVFKNIRVHDDIAVNRGGSIAWAMRMESPKLMKAVNGFLRKNRQGTLIGNTLLNRYLGDTKALDDALTGAGRAQYDVTIEIIQRYADEYGFDWRMIAAQGYQESGLDQSQRSHAGAIGVMQVMPATAADPSVGIPDISSAEANIHAGVKYMRHLRDHYFDAPGISPLDRVLFSLAAYNAGPGNIARARRRAARMGFDENRWFGHVEAAAA
ncbi:MAG: lytic transglycosylase F, partial [Proteobacteria bacterium]|nr:lytic transglycosylase F [Pseudomonadota bacterium]